MVDYYCNLKTEGPELLDSILLFLIDSLLGNGTQDKDICSLAGETCEGEEAGAGSELQFMDESS